MPAFVTTPSGTSLKLTVPWTVDNGVRADGVIGSPWIDFNGLVTDTSGAGYQGDTFDASSTLTVTNYQGFTSSGIGWTSGYNGRIAACRNTGVSDGFEIIIRLATNSSAAMSDLFNLLFSQPGPMAFAVNAGADVNQNNGLHFTSDVTTVRTGTNVVDGIDRWGYYIWSVKTHSPNVNPPPGPAWEIGWPYTSNANGPGSAVDMKMRFVGGSMECFVNGERLFGPLPVPTAFSGRTYHGYFVQQAAGPPNWNTSTNVTYIKPWIFRTYAGALGAAPTTPTAGNATSVKTTAGSTSVTPTWPSDVAAGKRVWVLVYKNAAGTVTAPVDHTWFVGATAVQPAGQRYDTFETLCNGSEVAGQPIGAFTGASASYCAVAVTISNPHPIYGRGGGQFNASAATISTPAYGIVGRYRMWLFAGACATSTITAPAGYSTVINTGTGGNNVLNVGIFSKAIGLLPDEIGYNGPAVTAALSPNTSSLGGMFEWMADPR